MKERESTRDFSFKMAEPVTHTRSSLVSLFSVTLSGNGGKPVHRHIQQRAKMRDEDGVMLMYTLKSRLPNSSCCGSPQFPDSYSSWCGNSMTHPRSLPINGLFLLKLARLIYSRRTLANCDTVIYDKNYISGLVPLPGKELLKPCNFLSEENRKVCLLLY